MSDTEKGLNRRSFLARSSVTMGACALATGVTAGALLKPATASASPLNFNLTSLDVEKVRQYGFEEYFQAGCGHASSTGLIRAFQDAFAGDPDNAWHQLPYGMYAYGAGGAVGWGTLCGALNGALAVLNLVGLHGTLGNALMQWYADANFPLANLDGYVPSNNYANPVPAPIPDYAVEGHSVPDSPLCHNSVTKWLHEANADLTSTDTIGRNLKKDRCAKVAGDTAAYAAQLINDYLAGTIPPAWAPNANYADCFDCHAVDNMDISGKMDCTDCHTSEGAEIVSTSHRSGSGS